MHGMSCSLNCLMNQQVTSFVLLNDNHILHLILFQAHLDSGGYEGSAMNRKFKYSRFKPIKTYKDSDGGSAYSCVSFSVSPQQASVSYQSLLYVVSL